MVIYIILGKNRWQFTVVKSSCCDAYVVSERDTSL